MGRAVGKIAVIMTLWAIGGGAANVACQHRVPTRMPSASVQMPAAIFSIVRNDSTSQVKIEYQSQGQWEQVQIDAKKDANIKGDQIRVSTDREDHATITVTLPVEGGKKYHLFWNSQAGMWDLGSVAQ